MMAELSPEAAMSEEMEVMDQLYVGGVRAAGLIVLSPDHPAATKRGP